MNYQPFLEMNVLLSDPMLQAVQDNKFLLIVFGLAAFYSLMLLHLVSFAVVVQFLSTLRPRSSSVSMTKDSV